MKRVQENADGGGGDDEGEGRRVPLTRSQRPYASFLQAYLGLSDTQLSKDLAELRSHSVIGILRGAPYVRTAQRFLRHSVLAVEGDRCFPMMCYPADKGVLQKALQEGRVYPNARVVALHYGVEAHEEGSSTTRGPSSSAPPSPVSQPPWAKRQTIRAILSTTMIPKGGRVFVCPASVERCQDEERWYRRRYADVLSTPFPPPSAAEEEEKGEGSGRSSSSVFVKKVAHWPQGLPFYHGIGDRHREEMPYLDHAKPTVGFPTSLTDIVPCPEMGDRQYGVSAVLPIPYGMCFLYTGAVGLRPSLQEKNQSTTQKTSAASVETKCSEFVSLGPSHSSSTSSLEEREEGDREGANPFPPLIPPEDCYALTIGRGVTCYGQGVMRYVNHRYLSQPMGNVEFVSVMVAVPHRLQSELTPTSAPTTTATSDQRKTTTKTTTHGRKRRRSPDGNENDETIIDGAPRLPPPDENTNNVDDEAEEETEWEEEQEQEQEQVSTRRATGAHRTVFDDNHTFLSIPFFIATTDIEPGQPLLAHTYGADYDARMERLVLCSGFSVPFACRRLCQITLPTSPSSPTPQLHDDNNNKEETTKHESEEGTAAHPPPPQPSPSSSIMSQMLRDHYCGDYRQVIGATGTLVWFPQLVGTAAPGRDNFLSCLMDSMFVVVDSSPYRGWLLVSPLLLPSTTSRDSPLLSGGDRFVMESPLEGSEDCPQRAEVAATNWLSARLLAHLESRRIVEAESGFAPPSTTDENEWEVDTWRWLYRVPAVQELLPRFSTGLSDVLRSLNRCHRKSNINNHHHRHCHGLLQVVRADEVCILFEGSDYQRLTDDGKWIGFSKAHLASLCGREEQKKGDLLLQQHPKKVADMTTTTTTAHLHPQLHFPSSPRDLVSVTMYTEGLWWELILEGLRPYIGQAAEHRRLELQRRLRAKPQKRAKLR